LIADRSRVVIEIGLAYGSSALAIGEALTSVEDAQHLIIDAFQDRFGNVGWDSVVEAGLETICELHPELSQLALPRLVAEGLVADAAFVDGSHAFHNVFVDLDFLRELVRPGGLIILDACDWPSAATAVHYHEVDLAWTPAAPGLAGRLRPFRLPDPRVEPRVEDFEPFGV
jgi:predicted O-methyltransferase YrrM